MIQLGIINPQDDETRLEVLKQFGEVKLLGGRSLDMEYAARVQDRFEHDPGYVPQVRPAIDNSFVLMMESISFAKTQEFEALPPDRQQQWIDYCDQLALAVAQRRQALAALGMNPDAPPLAEVPGQEAQAAMAVAPPPQAGAPGGGSGPQPPPAPGNAGFQPQQTPDIADSMQPPGLQPQNGHVTPEGSPRSIPILGA